MNGWRAAKRTLVFLFAILVFFCASASPVFAISDEKSAAIKSFLDEACRVSGVPGMSVSIISGDEILYFSSGYANRKTGAKANENTLFELASLSKAFTGLGILLLEEQGQISLTDSVQKYLPRFTLQYEGKPVDMQSLTLANFLHHTSGLTNGAHTVKIPEGGSPDMLQKTVEALSGAELSFAPCTEYSYGTVNYDVLGLVIEQVSGQSYEDFMCENVLAPLGLHQTFLYSQEAAATGNMAQGYRTSFCVTTPYNAPEYAGNKPAGYIISCAKDMARWMGIQLGTVQDIPEIFRDIIKKSHMGDSSVPSSNEMYYAAGWNVNSTQTIMEHAGGNPAFATYVALLADESTGICLLSNGANTNVGLVANIKAILDGKLDQTYEKSGTQLLDISMTCLTAAFLLLTAIFVILGARRKKAYAGRKPTKKRKIATALLLIIAISLCTVCFALPWHSILVWLTYSVLSALISTALLAASGAWFVYTKR